jgi:putative ABC transport system substrate-binding protein
MAIHIRRREFIGALGGATAAWPLAARAQQPAMPVVGFIRNTSPDESAYLVTALRQGLNEAGYVDGKNITIEYRWAGGHQDRLPALVADFVRTQVALIVAGGEAAIFAAKAATTQIPIVFVTGGDPVNLGFVSRLNRPGGTVTGITFLSNTLRTKQLELLHELVPTASVIAMLVNPNIPNTDDHVKEQQLAARALGLSLQVIKAGGEPDFEKAFASLAQLRAGALYIDGDSLFTGRRKQLVALTARYAMPTVFNDRESVTAGGLMSYGASTTDAYRQAGIYAGRILKGESAAELPVMQPTKFDLVINLKTAKALGIEVPTSMQLLADEVIE